MTKFPRLSFTEKSRDRAAGFATEEELSAAEGKELKGNGEVPGKLGHSEGRSPLFFS